jgi:molybdopterin/thiamine biosynthesis adenylyltransferase
LTLFDKDMLTAENVHRHALGMQDVNQMKAIAMAQHLKRMFPHLSCEGFAEEIEQRIGKTEFFAPFDLIINATGNETLGLLLNELLYPQKPVLHCWLDPMGLGGHVVYVKPQPHRGCYRCLFRMDETFGLYNAASFAAPGQDVTRTFSGCSGVYTPFSNLDSIRTATEAVRLGGKALAGELDSSHLVSWYGNGKDFVNAGFVLSKRASLGNQCLIDVVNFSDQDCSVCGVGV